MNCKIKASTSHKKNVFLDSSFGKSQQQKCFLTANLENYTNKDPFLLVFKIIFQHKYGWRFQKRPGVDMFMHQLGYPNFELVVYTIENGMTFFNIIDGLDPQNQCINYR